MRGMSGKSLNIGPRQIEQLPIPERKYLQEYTGKIIPNMHVHSASNMHNRLSLLGKLLHHALDEKILGQADTIVREIMNTSL